MSRRFPAYLVRGDDPVLVGEAARDLIHELVGDGDVSLVVEEVGGDDAATVIPAVVDAAQTPPFLTDFRVVVLRDVGRFTSEEVAPLVAYLATPMDTSSIVLVAGGGQLSQKLANAVKKAGHVVDAGVPKQTRQREAWLAERLRGAPVTFDKGAAALLGRHLGEDVARLGALFSVLEAAYGTGARLTADDVEPFLGEAGGVAPWDLTDAIDQGRIGDAIALARRMTGAGRHPLQVLAVLHTHFARMLRLDGAGARDEADAAAMLGITGSTFPAKKALAQARRLGSEAIADAIRLLARADLDLKGKRDVPAELTLEVLVARLARLSPRR